MKKALSIVLFFALVFSLCACGSSVSKLDTAAEDYSVSGVAPYYSASDYGSYDADFTGAAYAEEAYAEEPAEAYGGFAADNSASEVSVQESDGADINPEKIIYSANSQLETTEFDDTISKLSQLIESYGGFVESSSISSSNYYSQSHGYPSTRSASYTIRIPSSDFSAMMSALPSLGNVPYTNTYTENITSQYYDVQARLNAYKTQESRLLEMMEIAETVEDIITIEDRLTEVRYEIESLQSSLNNWDREVSYSTLYLEVVEVEKYTPVETAKTSYAEKLLVAAKNGLSSVGSFFAEFLLWLIEALPTLVILGLIGWGAAAIIKKRISTRDDRKARRQQRKAARLAKKAPAPEDEAEAKAEE